jgi:hypothetical protein
MTRARSDFRITEYRELRRDLRAAAVWRRLVSILATAAAGAALYFYFTAPGVGARVWAATAAAAAYWGWLVLVTRLSRTQRIRLARARRLEGGAGYYVAAAAADEAVKSAGIRALWRARSAGGIEDLAAKLSWPNLKYYVAVVVTLVWSVVATASALEYVWELWLKGFKDLWHRVF